MEEVPEFSTGDEKSYKFVPIKGKSFRFFVKAAHDCHLAFTSDAEETSPMFEVFIGAWEGEASAIRFNKDFNDLDKVDTPDILSEDEFREFWVTFNDDHVQVGKGGEWDPFLSASLPEHVEVTFIGYSTGYGATGAFKFHNDRVYETDDSLTYQYEPFYGEHFTFAVSCGNDAHVAFTSAPEETVPMYEVFIGGWKNQSSAIRLNNDKDQTVVKADTPDIVCSDEERNFWISVKGGNIRVGRAGEEDSFMEYADAEAFKATFVGIRTGWGSSGSWRMGA